jgi:hypothetical protein
MKTIFEFELTSRNNSLYKTIRDDHYVPNHGCIGRQLHYIIWFEDLPVGIISGASAVWACKPRDEFFGVTVENRTTQINRIIDNVVFRLIDNTYNYGTQILSQWRKLILKDWCVKYGDNPIGFETFVYGDNRKGSMYKADNWDYVGMTAGSAKCKPHGAYNKGERKQTDVKYIFVKTV